MSEEIRSISDVRGELGLQREQVKIDELVGQEIVVVGIRRWTGRFGECWTINLVREGEPLFCVTGATVVTQKLVEIHEHFPITATIIREDEYYDIV